jgi:hypothetical protein
VRLISRSNSTGLARTRMADSSSGNREATTDDYSIEQGVDRLVLSRPSVVEVDVAGTARSEVSNDSSTLTTGKKGGLLGGKKKDSKGKRSPNRRSTTGEERLLTAGSVASTGGGSNKAASRPPTASDVLRDQLISAAGMLAHVGEYMKPEYELGRLKRWTGCWNCCGDTEIYSITCGTYEKREKYHRQKVEIQAQEGAEAARRKLAKERRRKWAEDKKAYEAELERQKSAMVEVDAGEYYKRAYKQGLPPGTVKNNMPLWEKALVNSNVYDHLLESLDGGNVCMVVSTMRKNAFVEFYQEQGLKALNHLAKHHESRVMSLHHNSLKAVLCAQKTHPHNMDIQGLCVEVLGTYSTHHDSMKAITGDPECAINTVKNLIHFENKPEIVGKLLAVLRAVSANPERIPFLIKSRAFHSVTRIMKMHPDEPELISDGLGCWQNAASTFEGRELVMELNLIPFCVTIVQKYSAAQNPKILGNAIGIVTFACADVEGCIELLEVHGLETVLSGMKKLIGSHKLQLRGLVMVHNVSKLDGGWEELDRIPGAWQWLTQGVDRGNILLHYNKGHFYNRGWSIGDAPHRTTLDPVPVGAPRRIRETWTVQKLREFMGVKYPEQMYKIGFDKKTFEVYFRYIGEHGLYPFTTEQREAWFARVRQYEEFNGISIKDLVEEEAENRTSSTSSSYTSHSGVKFNHIEISQALAALDWPDSRPNSRQDIASRGASRGKSRSRGHSRGLPGDALMTYSRSSSRNEARTTTNSLDIYDRTMLTSADTDKSTEGKSMDHRPDAGASGRGSASGSASRNRLLLRQSALVQDRVDRPVSLRLGVSDINGLVGMQDPAGFGMMGSRPFSNESDHRPVSFSSTRPLSQEEGTRPSSVGMDLNARPGSGIVTFDLPPVEEGYSNRLLSDVAFGDKSGKADGFGGGRSSAGLKSSRSGMLLPPVPGSSSAD